MTAIPPGSRGFSSTELVAAIALLGLVAVAVTFIARPSLAKERNTLDMRAAPLVTAASEWRSANPSGCPTVGLLVSEGFLDSSVPRDDPWGGALRIKCNDGKLSVYSDGKDGNPGTSDDSQIEIP